MGGDSEVSLVGGNELRLRRGRKGAEGSSRCTFPVHRTIRAPEETQLIHHLYIPGPGEKA